MSFRSSTATSRFVVTAYEPETLDDDEQKYEPNDAERIMPPGRCCLFWGFRTRRQRKRNRRARTCLSVVEESKLRSRSGYIGVSRPPVASPGAPVGYAGRWLKA